LFISPRGSRFSSRSNGSFHGLLIEPDSWNREAFNDRFGMHRICYHESKEALYFAAEAKAILAVRPELGSADPRGLGNCRLRCILGNRTLLRHKCITASFGLDLSECSLNERVLLQPQEWESKHPWIGFLSASFLSVVVSTMLIKQYAIWRLATVTTYRYLSKIVAIESASSSSFIPKTFGSVALVDLDFRRASVNYESFFKSAR